jgi:hypothetical protein
MGSPYNGMGSPPMHFPMGSPHGFSAPPEQSFQSFGNGPMGPSSGQEQVNGKRPSANNTTQLSANVPDFSPSGSFPVGDQGVGGPNGEVSNGRADTGTLTNGHVENGIVNGNVNGVHADVGHA